MSADIWLCLSSSERALLREALAMLSRAEGADRKIRSLSRKIETARPLPETLLRVEGGFVEIAGNPNPVRVFDYDCDGVDDECLTPDEGGRACIQSEYEPVHKHIT